MILIFRVKLDEVGAPTPDADHQPAVVFRVLLSVKELCEVVGKGGGLTVAPTHMLEPDVPYENIEAFVKAAKNYGKY